MQVNKTYQKDHLLSLEGLRMVGVGLILLALVLGCSNRSNVSEKKTFPKVYAPTIYIDQKAQAEYLTMHFWDNFDFSDTTWVGSAGLITEQALVDYITILPYASYNVICNGIKHLLDQADTNQAMYAFFYSKMEWYFSNANSTLSSEEFYIPLLEHMITSNSLDEQRKARPKSILPLLEINRPGMQAANIHYTKISGAKDSLTSLKSDYILIVFYDFECEDCNVLKGLIEESTAVKEMQKQKKLAILGIYPGANMEGWKKSATQVPTSWINGYDHNEEIGQLGTYILLKIPTLYLLDKNYMVIMKDPPFDYVEYFLNGILSPPA